MIKHFLAILDNGHYGADQVYFYESNSRKSAVFAARAPKVDNFKRWYFWIGEQFGTTWQVPNFFLFQKSLHPIGDCVLGMNDTYVEVEDLMTLCL